MRRTLLVLTAIAFTQTACFGSFAATRSLWRFNQGVSGNKWVQEAVFLGLAIVPVYSLFVLGDVIIFNSVEFWTGSNPLADGSTPGKREVMLADGSTARLVRDADGMRIEHGDAVWYLHRGPEGMELRDGEGKLISAVREAEGGAIEVVDAAGNTERVHPAELAEAGHSPESVTAWVLARAGR